MVQGLPCNAQRLLSHVAQSLFNTASPGVALKLLLIFGLSSAEVHRIFNTRSDQYPIGALQV